ncbi:MAG TPA: aldehyde dehydrogenase family protein, partial [Rhodobacteraceae bacterium]|nr:aldehyde dehydrogenase family protein [Paracoccaceae bacterium]
MSDTWFDASKCLIGGEWVDPQGGETLSLENPSTGEELSRIARGQKADVDAAVRAAEAAL